MLDFLSGIALGLLAGWLIWIKFPKIGEIIRVALIAAKNNVIAWFKTVFKKGV